METDSDVLMILKTGEVIKKDDKLYICRRVRTQLCWDEFVTIETKSEAIFAIQQVQLFRDSSVQQFRIMRRGTDNRLDTVYS